MKIGRGDFRKTDGSHQTRKDFDDFRSGVRLAEAGKLGALLLQYPAGFHFSADNLEKVQNTLRRFYDYPKAVELRHKSWTENSAEMESLLVKIEQAEPSIDEPNSRLQSSRN